MPQHLGPWVLQVSMFEATLVLSGLLSVAGLAPT